MSSETTRPLPTSAVPVVPNDAGPARPPGPLEELWRHRVLLRQFTARNLELRHRGSVLGILWAIGNPLLMLGIYVTVFGFIFGGSFEEDPVNSKASFALTVFLGLAVFHFVAEVNAVAPSTIVSSPNFVKKVVFPLPVLPAAAVGAALVHFGISLFMVVVAAQVIGLPMWDRLGGLVVHLAPMVLLALGLAWMLAAIAVFVRDVSQIVQFANLVLLYASAVFFSTSAIPAAGWAILKYNPVLQIINETRRVVFWGGAWDPLRLAYIYAAGIASLLVGSWVFRKLRPGFSDAL